jgi:hypothetical protein
MLDRMAYVKLKRHNDWGCVYFSKPGEGLSEYGTASARKYGLDLPEGKVLRVRWPDGSETTEEVRFQRRNESYSDMGHRTDYVELVAGVAPTVRGIRTWVPLDAVEVDDTDLDKAGAK